MFKKLMAMFAGVFLCCGVGWVCAGEEPAPKPPDEAQIKQALERGKTLREQKGVVPEALMKSAVILKTGPERCGHALVRIEDARGEGGAVYKLVEKLKVAIPQGSDLDVVEYTGELLLAADLSLMSGKQASTKTVLSGKVSKSETGTAKISVEGGELKWEHREKSDDSPETISNPESAKLHGVRPIPRNAVIAIAALASKEAGFMPGVTSPYLVPTMDMGTNIDTLIVQPAWITFENPKDKSNPALKLLMTVRYLDCAIDETGMKVEPPPPDIWADTMIWSYDQKLNVLSQPSAGDAMMQVETTDPDKLNLDEPLNFGQIKVEFKKLDEKVQKEKDAANGITKVPLKGEAKPDPNGVPK